MSPLDLLDGDDAVEMCLFSTIFLSVYLRTNLDSILNSKVIALHKSLVGWAVPTGTT